MSWPSRVLWYLQENTYRRTLHGGDVDPSVMKPFSCSSWSEFSIETWQVNVERWIWKISAKPWLYHYFGKRYGVLGVQHARRAQEYSCVLRSGWFIWFWIMDKYHQQRVACRDSYRLKDEERDFMEFDQALDALAKIPCLGIRLFEWRVMFSVYSASYWKVSISLIWCRLAIRW